MKATKANLACGRDLIVRAGWTNVDLVPRDPAVIEGDLYSLPFEDDSMDELVCSHALEHLDDPARAIREAWRALRKGGSYIVAVPDGDKKQAWLASYLVNLHEHDYSDEQKHRIDFTPASLKELVGSTAEWSCVAIADPVQYWQLPGKGSWQVCLVATK